ncbi:Heme-degrading monooxygenase HmoA [Parasphingorhabdus marina DSM 22363]|uniref:Heme-degrading monooxygenase HmoA n=1 Tax=Parasphingorhabdus marina DSM 22363 TaxID=1123272 RepID=A0A1N6CNS6_9SPHN|nr:antibiotic biosynthesis monooxygenase [Parasphingorhabdus marina]SIN60238.1 Heme-degrading monooxygenase HmoA [Parasphingorhabdus marina DSM 22363]
MIVEQALLEIRPGQSQAFAKAMQQARGLISRQPGFQSIEVRPDCDREDRYLLLVCWDSISAHRDGFRQSAEYPEWRDLLHQFYDPMPVVTYYGQCIFYD